MPHRNSCRVVVGRLLEVNVRHGLRTMQDVEDMTRQFRAAIDAAASTVRYVVVADWGTAGVLSPAIAARAGQMMTTNNKRIERSALLHAGDSSTATLQLVRLIRETETPSRRLFTHADRLQLWLRDVLSEAEQERLHAFLSPEHPSAAAFDQRQNTPGK